MVVRRLARGACDLVMGRVRDESEVEVKRADRKLKYLYVRDAGRRILSCRVFYVGSEPNYGAMLLMWTVSAGSSGLARMILETWVCTRTLIPGGAHGRGWSQFRDLSVVVGDDAVSIMAASRAPISRNGLGIEHRESVSTASVPAQASHSAEHLVSIW
jgi:hypothetical protein